MKNQSENMILFFEWWSKWLLRIFECFPCDPIVPNKMFENMNELQFKCQVVWTRKSLVASCLWVVAGEKIYLSSCASILLLVFWGRHRRGTHFCKKQLTIGAYITPLFFFFILFSIERIGRKRERSVKEICQRYMSFSMKCIQILLPLYHAWISRLSIAVEVLVVALWAQTAVVPAYYHKQESVLTLQSLNALPLLIRLAPILQVLDQRKKKQWCSN